MLNNTANPPFDYGRRWEVGKGGESREGGRVSGGSPQWNAIQHDKPFVYGRDRSSKRREKLEQGGGAVQGRERGKGGGVMHLSVV